MYMHTCAHMNMSIHGHTHTHTERLEFFFVFLTSGGTHINQYQITTSLTPLLFTSLPYPIMVYKSAKTLAKGALQTFKIGVRMLLVACLPSMHYSLGSMQTPHKLCVVVHVYNPSTQEVEWGNRRIKKKKFKVIFNYTANSRPV